jgi:hypothetical protein
MVFGDRHPKQDDEPRADDIPGKPRFGDAAAARRTADEARRNAEEARPRNYTCGGCGWFSVVAPRGRCRLNQEPEAEEEGGTVGWCCALPTTASVSFKADPCSMWKDGPMVVRGGSR